MSFSFLTLNYSFHAVSSFSCYSAIPKCISTFPSYSTQNSPWLSEHVNILRHTTCCAKPTRKSSPNSAHSTNSHSKKTSKRFQKTGISETEDKDSETTIPPIIPKKPRRGRKSEAAAMEDFVRDSLERTFTAIRQQNADIFEGKDKIIKEKINDEIASDQSSEDDDDNDDEDGGMEGKKMVVEEDDPHWPLDAEVGWGIRASEYFDQHAIKNVIGEDGNEIDWVGEIDDTYIKEINCLEWESFVFHPSPLIVLVFERYNGASQNWKVLKELEKAAKVYWDAKDRLPPRTVKIDINIERDLAYALKVRECPEILFLRGTRILYREKDMRTADELVQMIAHFYYNAKKPSCINDAALCPPF